MVNAFLSSKNAHLSNAQKMNTLLSLNQRTGINLYTISRMTLINAVIFNTMALMETSYLTPLGMIGAGGVGVNMVMTHLVPRSVPS